MNTTAIIEALSVTDENISEMIDLMGEDLANNNDILHEAISSYTTYNTKAGANSILNLSFAELFNLAYLSGYVKALREVQTIQRLELEAIHE